MFKNLVIVICILFITSCSFLKVKKAEVDFCADAPTASKFCSVAKALDWNLNDLNEKIMKANLVAVASGQIKCDEIISTTKEIRTVLENVPPGRLTYEKMIYYLKDTSKETRKGIAITLILIGDDIDYFAVPEVVDPYDMKLILGLLNNIDSKVNTEGRLLEELVK